MDTNQLQISSTAKFFITIAAVGLTLFFMREASSMIVSLVLSAIIVVSFTPLLYSLISRGVNSILAFSITLVAIILLFGGLVIFVAIAIDRFIEAIPTYTESLESSLATIEATIESWGILGALDFEAFFDLLDPSKMLDLVANFFLGLVSAFSNIFLVILIIVFLLVDALDLPKKLAPYLRVGDRLVTRVSSFGSDIRLYIIVTTIVGLATGAIDTVFFIIMGVDFPVLWGALAFFMSYIPTIGFWLALIPPVILAFLESGFTTAAIVFIGIVIINGFAENVIKPKYMGSELDLSPFTVVFSVVFWSAILGPFGAILSVPMTMAFKSLILEPDPANRWIADLLSAQPHGPDMDDKEAIDTLVDAVGPPESTSEK